jgi:hypothetical protein
MELNEEQIALAKYIKKNGFHDDTWDTALRFLLVITGLPESDLDLIKKQIPKPSVSDLRKELKGYTFTLPMSSVSSTPTTLSFLIDIRSVTNNS